MNESKLCTIEQIEQFLKASTLVEFSAHGNDTERYAHISRVLKRFDYPQRNKRERGVLLEYLRHTSGYSRPQFIGSVEFGRPTQGETEQWLSQPIPSARR